MSQRSCKGGGGKYERIKTLSWNSLGLLEPLERRLLLSNAIAPYSFQNALITGGGFVNGVFFSPSQSGVVYASTDIGGIFKSTDDGTTWTELLDFVGNNGNTSANGTNSQMFGILSAALDPENPNDLYLDTGQYTNENGALLYSSDGGQTFGITPLPFYVGGNSNGRATGERLAVDPDDSNVLLIGSNDDGLWESTDQGQSFSLVSSFTASGTLGITFVSFQPFGTMGSPTQIAYVGVNSTAAGSNLYETQDGGNSWSEISGTGGPTGLIPMRTALSPDGNDLYVTYGNQLPPDDNMTTGAVWRYDIAANSWTNISPVTPGKISGDNFGYDGVTLDPNNPNALVVGSFDRYDDTDQLWRTTDATAAKPTWTALFDSNGYASDNPTRNTSAAPWEAAFDDGVGNWPGAIAIDPFNSAHLLYGNGQGLWATNDGTTSTTLTAPNSWYFPDTGIEFTETFQLAAPGQGVPLYSAMSDLFGFTHTTLTSSPAAGADSYGEGLNSGTSVAFAGQNPDDAVVVGASGSTNNGVYTNNDGATWTEFAANPGGASTDSEGTVAMNADGSTIVWAPSGAGAYYSANHGASWTASSGVPVGGTVLADSVNPNYFYYWDEISGRWALYISSDGGKTFAPSAGGSLATDNVTMTVNPSVAGDIWIAGYNGIYHSSDFGASFTHVGSSFIGPTALALGAAAPGTHTPALYVYASIGGFAGVFRSDDGANTWIQLNDLDHQYGGVISSLAADPNVYGRVYLGTNGRGIIVGNPIGSLPANFVDADINKPGNPGFAYDSTPLSSGSSADGWVVNGGGSGIGGTSDQFNFAYEPIMGNMEISAQLGGLDNPDNAGGSPRAGVMVRASTAANAAFVALLQTAGNELVLQSRSASGGTTSSTTLGSVPVGSEFVELIRNGNIFSAYYSPDGVNLRQIGANITINAMPADADAGIAVTAGYNPQLATASFSQVLITTGAPTFTNTSSATFLAGAAGAFDITATGDGPDPLTFSDNNATLPSGVSFTDMGNGTAILEGTPAAGTGGTYPITLTADDGAMPTIEQFTLTVDQTPAITSAASVALAPGKAATFTITSTGYPIPLSILEFGELPSGISLVSTGANTAEFKGIAPANRAGAYDIMLLAVNASGGSVPQEFTLTIDQAPAFTSPSQATFIARTAGTFAIIAGGLPAPAISESGNLPAGVTFNSGNGTATLTGTPLAGSDGTYKITLTAANEMSSTAQHLTLTVDQAPAISTAAVPTFTAGKLGTFNIAASGFPLPASFFVVGTLPDGVALLDGHGSAQLKGTPGVHAGGTYVITVGASNGISPVAEQAFTLVVDQAPAFSSPNSSETFIVGTTGTFFITTAGIGQPISLSDNQAALPAGLIFTDLGNGTAELAGTPQGAGGTYRFTLTAANGTTPTRQAFTLIVKKPATISTAASATFTIGKRGTFTINATGLPSPASIFEYGALPSGITLTQSGPHSAELEGTAAANTAGTYAITLNADNGVPGLQQQIFMLVIS